jgi:hypothetical protein
MNDFDQLYHHQDGNDINILHYYMMMNQIWDIQIRLNHKLKEKNMVNIQEVNITLLYIYPTYTIILVFFSLQEK